MQTNVGPSSDNNELIRAHMRDVNNWSDKEARCRYSDSHLTTVFQASASDYQKWVDEAKSWHESQVST